MGMANEMQKLADEILASYKVRADELQQRLKDNDLMVKDVQEMLQGFRNDHQEIVASIKANAEALKVSAKQLKADMAKDEQDRINSFKEMMDGINGAISRIKDEVVSIKLSTENMLKDFSVAHTEMTSSMQKDFADDKSNRAEWNAGRMNSFNEMMSGIHDDMDRISKEVAGIFAEVASFLVETNNMMKTFANEHSEMSAELRAKLKADLNLRQDETRTLLNQFNERLAEISKENMQMAETLHAELSKSRSDLKESDAQRLKDFKVTMGDIQGRVSEIQGFVNSFLGDLKSDRILASEIWDKLAIVKAGIGNVVQVVPVVEKQVRKAEKPQEPVVKPAPQPQADAQEEEMEFTLEEKILDHLAKHPEGVRVSDMEEPLESTRMKIGYIAKQLLEEGKITKVDNLYLLKS